MNCPRCGHENGVGARFCNECASPLAASCAACGAENPPGAKFCNGCGAPLGVVSVIALSNRMPRLSVRNQDT